MGGKKKKQIVEQQLKPKSLQITDLMDKSDMDKTEFLSFMPQDGMYPDKTYLLKGDRTLKIVMREILKQLNWLRYMSFKEFWATVQYNLSLKHCLESCLLFLQRRKYNEYMHTTANDEDDLQDEQNLDKLPPNQQVLQYQQHIYQIVLTIYFRILHSQDQDPILSKQFKCAQSIYDNWIMDIPKLFNFMEIYGESNPQITKNIVQKVFQLNGDYKLDFIDVLGLMSRHVFTDIFQEFKFLHDRSQFESEITEDTLRKKMKHFLLIKDITTSFVNVFEFFPLESHIYVASSDVLLYLENLYYEIFSAYKNWEFNQFKQSVQALMDSIQQDIVKIWIHIFALVRKVVLEQTNMSYIKDFYKVKQDVIENLNILADEFGVIMSQGKKGREKRNYMLLEQVMEGFDVGEFLTEVLEIENKKINQLKIKELLNVVQKLTQLKEKRQKQDQESQIPQVKKQPQQQSSFPQIVNIRKESSHRIQKSESKQQKQDKITTRMQRVRKPQKLEKTNERQYEDEYDDFYDFNRKIEENKAGDSDDEIEEIQENPNRRYNNTSKNYNTGNNNNSYREGVTGTGKYQDKNNTSKYSDKKSFKEPEKLDGKSYRESKRDQGYKRDDNYKRGDKKDNYKPGGGSGGGKKPQYREK